MQEVNRRVREYNYRNEQLHYVDLATPLLGTDVRPDDALFQDDRLHLNERGYAIWNRILAPERIRLY